MARTVLPILIVALCAGATTFANAVHPNLDKTLAAQRELVAQSPYDARAFNDLGNLLVLAGSEAEAEEAYRRALEIDPANAGARFNLGVLLQQHGQRQEALEQYRQLVEIAPEHAWARYQMGVIYEERGDRSKALDNYARAFAYDPNLSFAENNPHVIDNQLSTEALLLAPRYQKQAAVKVPRLYDDPARIAELMLEMEEEAAGAEEMAAQVEEEIAAEEVATGKKRGKKADDAATERRNRRRQAAAGEDETAAAAPRQRQISSDDLDDTGLRGSSEGGAVVGIGVAPVQSGRERPSVNRSAPRERLSVTEGESTPRERTRSRDANEPSTQTGVAPRRWRYRPGTVSTGRLELQLLPAEPAEQRAAAATPAAR